MKLMERAMAWVFTYRKMEAEMKRVFPLWRQNIISGRYWLSIKAAEEKLEKEFADIKKEVQLIDPAAGGANTEIFKEACRIIDTYGYPPKPPESGSPLSQQPGKPLQGPCVRVTDNETYELLQQADDAELILFVPKETNAKDVKVALLPASITVTRCGALIFSEKLPDEANIKKEGCSWSLMKKGDFEPGDNVELFGLTNESLNGTVGKVLKGTTETIAKGRIRIETKDKKTLSIQPKNIKNNDETRKAAIVISLEKAKPKSVWPMPPWKPNATHNRTFATMSNNNTTGAGSR